MSRIKNDAKQNYMLGVLGKIKAGKIAEGKNYPTSTDYFVFTSNQPRRIERLKKLLGDKPTSIPVTFHSDNTNDVCIERFELRDSAGRLAVKGDGKTWKKSMEKDWVDITEDEAKKIKEKLTTEKFKAKLTRTLILRCIILGYPELGTWEFRSKGFKTSIPQIISTFDLTMEMAGRVRMIPFNLTIHKHKSNRANANRQYPVVNLTCDLSPEMVEKVSELSGSSVKLLTAEKITSLNLPSPDIDEAQIIEDGQ